MKVIAQPESYSDMLERIFAMTVVSGFVCTVILASASPAVRAMLDSIKTEAEIGPIKGLKSLYVLIPIAIALVSRVVRLHDRLSDLLHLRISFDTRYILFPIASLSGLKLDQNTKQCIRSVRVPAMYKVFYPYAGFDAPAIDKQLVRTALDNWGWFWVGIESAFLFIVTGIIVMIIGGGIQVLICLIVLLLIGLLLTIQWFACRRSADRQVKAIMDEPKRRANIHDYFADIVQESARAGVGSQKSG